MNVDDDTVIIMTAGEPIQDDDANTIIRHSINFPPGLYRTLQERAKKQYRSMSSIVLEACDFYLSGDIEEQTIQFLNSEKGRNLIKQIIEQEKTREKTG
jgi:metal-responsive CopG/Arc/MetJ family transcriptional regulator